MKKLLIVSIAFALIACVATVSIADTNQTITINTAYYGPDWDISHDGRTNYLDVSSLVNHYGLTGEPHWIRDDITRDGVVNYLDVSVLTVHYGEVWIVG